MCQTFDAITARRELHSVQQYNCFPFSRARRGRGEGADRRGELSRGVSQLEMRVNSTDLCVICVT